MKQRGIKRRVWVRLWFGVTLIALLSACAKPPAPDSPKPTAAETPRIEALPPAPPPPPSPAVLPAPTPADLHEVITRIFQDAVRLTPDAAPVYAVGDFNGDQRQDVALVVEPVKEKLDELNSDVAAWRIRDPLAEATPQPVMAIKRDEPTERPVITATDTRLVAIIHGYGPEGWRNPEARQTLVLKNVAGSSLKVLPRKAAKTANKYGPTLLGDVIQTTAAGAQGYIYYQRSVYAWYDPRNYRGEVAARLAH